MSSQILPHTNMYHSRRDSGEVQEKAIEIDQDSNPGLTSGSNSPTHDHPKNLKFYQHQNSDDEKTILSHQTNKKSFCIDALLSKHIEPDQNLAQDKNHQKYLAFIQHTKNYIPRYNDAENYDNQIEHSTINKYEKYERPASRPSEDHRSQSGASSPRSGSPGSEDGNRSGCSSPPISPGVEGGQDEYEAYRPGIIPKPGLLPQNPALVAAQSALFYPPGSSHIPSGIPSAFHHPGADRVALHHMQLEWLARTGMLYHRIPELGVEVVTLQNPDRAVPPCTLPFVRRQTYLFRHFIHTSIASKLLRN
ncbi:hypothetical protein EVAR_7379_1 [Eumeta japonica]|uniref:Uncharacterized protein n=1 Tax=Eumeta variegata TaxID=151549 RepID=A0A4C1V657_EUMVA|nr:hypothetical protein EVAR_7379_1 [Eumeta japonica]